MILFSSLTLAIDDPLKETPTILTALDIIFNIFFFLEFVIKAVSLGFALHRGAYLRNGWNALDFIIVIISFMAMAGVGPGKSLRALRTVRVLRPLRMVNKLPELQLVVNALMNSIPAVANVLLICFLFFLIFAILGVNLFKGKLYSCGGSGSYDDDDCPFSDEILCGLVENPVAYNMMTATEGASLRNSCAINFVDGVARLPTSREICDCEDPSAWAKVLPRSFDNVGDALLLLYELSTTEGWVDYMYATVDSEGVDMQPRRYLQDANGNPDYDDKSSTALIILFYVMFIVVGSFFVINLFVGVVIDNFNSLKAAKSGGSVFMTDEQREWSNTKKFVMKMPIKRKNLPPTSPFRKTMHDIMSIEKPIR